VLGRAGSASAQVRASMPSARQLMAHIPSEAPGVEVHHLFPGVAHPQHMVAGEDVTALLTIRNARAKGAINVTWAGGTITTPADFRVKLDNFTVTAFRTQIDAGSEHSFEYRFRTHPAMPSREFRVALTVFYNDLSTLLGHAATFFNQTVDIVEAEGFIDTQLLGLFGYLAAAAGLIGARLLACCSWRFACGTCRWVQLAQSAASSVWAATLPSQQSHQHDGSAQLCTLTRRADHAGYIIYSFWSDTPKGKEWAKKNARKAKAKAKETAAEAPAPVDKSDYLQGTPYAALEKKQAQRAQRRPGKKST
jgi:heme-degrading monooxygenase HmoA